MKRSLGNYLDVLAALLAFWIGIDEWWTNGSGAIPPLAILIGGLYLFRWIEGGKD